MKAIKLQNFIHENGLEFHYWHDADNVLSTDDVLLFIPTYEIDTFMKILGERYFAEDGIDCTMKYGYVVVQMQSIVEGLDATLEDVFGKGYEEK